MLQILINLFIIYFFLFLILPNFGIVIGKRWSNAADDSNQDSMPDLTSLNPYEIVALRDGRKGLIQTALFELWNRKLITSSGKEEQAEVKSVVNQQPKDEIEQVIYDFAHTTRKPADFFSDSGLRVHLDRHLKPINQHLEQLHLKPTAPQLKQAIQKQEIIWFIILGGGVIIGIGGFFEPLFNSEIEFSALFFLIFLSWILKSFILAPNKRQTQLGRRYYNKLLKHFEWMKSEEKSNIEPAFLISIFGRVDKFWPFRFI